MTLIRGIIVSLIVLVSTGCMKKESNTANDGAAATTQVASRGEIVVGAIFPMTGPIATYGQESMNGINLALKKINTDKINGKSIRIILEDNKGDPAESANAVRKVISVDKVHVVLGSVASSNTLAGAPIAQAAKVPLLTPASTNEAVTQKGDYIMRTCFTDEFQGLVMATFARKNLNKKRAVTIIDVASDYSRGLARVFKENFAKMGGTVVDGQFTYNQGDKDFRSLIRRVKRANPDVVFLPGYYSEAGVMLKQAREMKLSSPFLGGDGWDSPDLQGLAGSKGIKGNFISSHFVASDRDPEVQRFVASYKKSFGKPPGAMAALGYDAMMVIAEALRRVGDDLSHKRIRDALVMTKNHEGVTGKITIDENRNARKSAVVLETSAKGMLFKTKITP